jgi:tetratricopeptide (TPR) repeat protein
MTRALDIFQRARSLHREGQLARAEADYAEVLRLEPRHSAAIHHLGLIALQKGRSAEAWRLISRAIEIDPAAASMHFHLGKALYGMRQLETAVSSFSRAIDIKPDFAQAYCDRGMVLCELKRREDALRDYTQAIFIQADLAEAYCNRGDLLRELGRLDAALTSCDDAIRLKPDLAAAHNNRGLVLKELKRWEAARASFDRALAIRHEYAEAYCNRGIVLKELNHLQAALADYDRAIAVAPDYAEAYCYRGNLLGQMNRMEEALASCDKAISLRPDNAEAHCSRGSLLSQLNQVDAAITSFDRAIELEADFAQAHLNRAMALLLKGDYSNGWSAFEWRWKILDAAPDRHPRWRSRPLWLGVEPLAGKTIVLHSEQGLGDTIQFCRYVQAVAAAGARVVLEVQAPLKSLLAALPGAAHVVVKGEELPEFDFHCPLLSLPLAFKTTLATVPAHVPYLRADPEKALFWQRTLGEKRKRRVGLVWSGGLRLDQPELWSVNSRRNIPLATLLALQHPDIEFYSLQKGYPAEGELAELMAGASQHDRIVDHAGQLRDFADTAALIEELDLVIAVDTSTAHLAGALGKPVWILNRYDTCWRWLLDRTDSPWYPSARLYRQERPGDWEGVVRRVRHDLRLLVNSP